MCSHDVEQRVDAQPKIILLANIVHLLPLAPGLIIRRTFKDGVSQMLAHCWLNTRRRLLQGCQLKPDLGPLHTRD